MPFKKNNPGCNNVGIVACCCNQTCEIANDNFTRSNNTNISTGSSCGWTEVAGDWSIASNKLSISSTSAIALCGTAHPDSVSDMNLSCTVNVPSSGDLVRLIVAYQDSSNYHFAEFKFGTSPYVKLYKRSGGTDTLLVTNTSPGAIPVATDVTLSLCADTSDSSITAAVGSTPNTSYGFQTFAATGYSAAVGTGGTLASTATFDNLVLTKGQPDCTICRKSCGFFACTDGSPSQIEIVISGSTAGLSGDGSITLASSIDGVYYADGPLTGINDGGYDCWYCLDLPAGVVSSAFGSVDCLYVDLNHFGAGSNLLLTLRKPGNCAARPNNAYFLYSGAIPTPTICFSIHNTVITTNASNWGTLTLTAIA